jgi:hypothetical protein
MLFIFFISHFIVLYEVCLSIIYFVPVQNKYNTFVGTEVLLILNPMMTKVYS